MKKEIEFNLLGTLSEMIPSVQGFMIEGVTQKNLRGNKLLDFVENRISEKIGGMILDGMGFTLNQKV